MLTVLHSIKVWKRFLLSTIYVVFELHVYSEVRWMNKSRDSVRCLDSPLLPLHPRFWLLYTRFLMFHPHSLLFRSPLSPHHRNISTTCRTENYSLNKYKQYNLIFHFLINNFKKEEEKNKSKPNQNKLNWIVLNWIELNWIELNEMNWIVK